MLQQTSGGKSEEKVRK